MDEQAQKRGEELDGEEDALDEEDEHGQHSDDDVPVSDASDWRGVLAHVVEVS